jgi:hypothetical protein
MTSRDIRTPALRAMVELSVDGYVLVRWADGEEALVRYDTFLPSDETADGSEECVVDVIRTGARAPSNRALIAGTAATISSNDPPSEVATPDGARRWVFAAPV